jgi:hypothetical protein
MVCCTCAVTADGLGAAAQLQDIHSACLHHIAETGLPVHSISLTPPQVTSCSALASGSSNPPVAFSSASTGCTTDSPTQDLDAFQ